MRRAQRSMMTVIPAALALVVWTMVTTTDGLAFSSGPPDGHAGEPPAFQTCINCHDQFPLNSGDGTLQLLDVPSTVTPGMTYGLTVELADPGQSRWGFELTVLNDQDEASGTIVVTDPVRMQLSDNPQPQPDYLKHRSAGTAPGTPGPTQWSFEWIAGSDTEVDFYVAGNAANNDGGFFGDYIYAIQVTAGGATSVADGGSPGQPRGVVLHQNRPNPFNPSTSISFSLETAARVTLRILDTQGRVVRNLLDRGLGAGEVTVGWDGTDNAGARVPSGIYFYRLESGEQAATRKMHLVQ